ncbi:MAG: hypothetical protein NZ455_13650 [Bacteroidia bacterium]|nr:hypothetical protein [Bacteroidia bacterium]MDW8346782.1 hypothetical protein [Bacteroidia bacterium]
MLRATLTLRCYAALRTADAPSACLTQQRLDVLPCLCAYLCFTLFSVDYQLLTSLKFFTLFELRSFYLVLH